MSVIGSLLLVCALADAPAHLQATPHFYNAIGRVRLSWNADKTTMNLGDDFTLTLVVSGATNPASLRRPNLRAQAKFADRFEIRELPSPGEGRFAWSLRPRAADVADVPSLEYASYVPGSPDGRAMQTTFAKKLPLTVTAAPQLERPRASIPTPNRDGPTAFHWLALAAGLLVLPAAVVLLWRWRNPDGPRLARLRQSRATRQALAALDAAPSHADPVATVQATLRMLPESDAVRELLAACDAARFAPGPADATPLVAHARRLVLAGAA